MTQGQRLLTCLALSVLVNSVWAQSPAAKLEDFGFLHGYWVGTGFGGVSEEMWMPGGKGSLFGIFKQSSEAGINFTEYMEITRLDERWVLRLKHFNPDFTGWEYSTDYVTFPLLAVAPNRVEFEGLTYSLIPPATLRIELHLSETDGSSSTANFELRRQALPGNTP
jgi:hypothetical protein